MRDSHGRWPRRPLLPPSLPGYATRAGRFHRAVEAAARRLYACSPATMRDVEIALELVPPSDPAPWEDGVPVGRLFPAADGQPTRVVLYRKPIEARLDGPPEAAVRDIIVDHLAHFTGRSPHEIDPDYGRGATG